MAMLSCVKSFRTTVSTPLKLPRAMPENAAVGQQSDLKAFDGCQLPLTRQGATRLALTPGDTVTMQWRYPLAFRDMP